MLVLFTSVHSPQQVVARRLQARDGPILRRITVTGAGTQLATTSSGGDLSENSDHNHEDVSQVTVGHRGDKGSKVFSGQKNWEGR